MWSSEVSRSIRCILDMQTELKLLIFDGLQYLSYLETEKVTSQSGKEL